MKQKDWMKDGARILDRAANDNSPGRQRIVLRHFQPVPVLMDEIAVVDRLMEKWPEAANDNLLIP